MASCDQFKTHAVLSPSTFVLSLSPISQYLALSFCTLCLIPLYILPVLSPHKKRMMLHYDYHWFTDNKCLRMHQLFHLYLEYNKNSKIQPTHALHFGLNVLCYKKNSRKKNLRKFFEHTLWLSKPPRSQAAPACPAARLSSSPSASRIQLTRCLCYKTFFLY